MFALITTLSTNLLRTYIIYRFMRLFFWTDIEEKKKERACYVLFFILTAVSTSDILFARYECDNKYSADFFDYSVL